MWCFTKCEGSFRVLAIGLNRVTCPIATVDEGPSKNLLRVYFQDGQYKFLALTDFRAENTLSKPFVDVTGSRTAFIAKFADLQTKENAVSDVEYSGEASSADSEEENGGNTEDTVDKVVGEAITIHVKNLEPSPDLLRPVNSVHVAHLQQRIVTAGRVYKQIVVQKTSGDIKDSKIPGGARFSVLGGNHTLAAMKRLEETDAVAPYLVATVYSDLTEEEALKVALTHNLVDENSLSMTFIEKAQVIRKLKAIRPQWSRAACKAFGFKNTGETRRKLRTMAALASCSEQVWQKLSLVPVKSQLKQTFFTSFVRLPEDVQLSSLEPLVKGDMKAFKKKVMESVQNDDAPPKQSKQSNQATTSTSNRLEELEDENKQLKRELQAKDMIIKELQQQIIEQKRKNADDDAPTSTPSIKKQKSDPETTFNIREKVWALYAPIGDYFPAKILKKKQDCYTVRFIEDNVVVEVGKGEIRPFP